MKSRADIRLLARCDALIEDFGYQTRVAHMRLDSVQMTLTEFRADLVRKCPHRRVDPVQSLVDGELLGGVCSICHAVFPPTEFT